MATKKKEQAKGNNGTKKRSTDIPLDNIPERATHRTYTDEFKTQAAQRIIGGESDRVVAEELGVSRSLVSKWAQRVRQGLPITERGRGNIPKAATDNVAAMLTSALERASKAKDERLEAAARIVEADLGGSEGAALAKKIRAVKRQT